MQQGFFQVPGVRWRQNRVGIDKAHYIFAKGSIGKKYKWDSRWFQGMLVAVHARADKALVMTEKGSREHLV